MECFDSNPSEISRRCEGRISISCATAWKCSLCPGWHRPVRSLDRRFARQVFDARPEKTDDGRIEYTAKWNGNSQWKFLGRRPLDGGLAIPRADIDVRLEPRATARILLCRNIIHTRPDGEHEQNAVVFLDGDKFQTVEKFAALRLGGTAVPIPEAQVDVTLRPVVRP